MDFQDLLAQMAGFFGGEQNKGRSAWCDADLQRTRSYFLDCYLCATSGENRSRNTTVNVLTDRHMLWQRQT